ncbi:MAG: hypothetical protein DBX00_04910 [Verrucomicrobia bacterium]|nr:hypothetical protein [Roseibacillus sp.]RCL37277.1 MAG: hypothetical protein DBX00_04910 [Verrucomicrobiota bacterium]
MKQYQAEIADNPGVEMIHVSLDRDKKAAETWAAKEGFPWPTVMMDNLKKSGFEDYMPRGVPNYKLLSKDGKIVAEGKGEVFAKAAELTKEET